MGLWQSDPTTLMFVVAIVALMGTLFGWLTVAINDRQMRVKMGIGLIRRSVSLDTIRGFAPVRNPWYYGWGVRFTPHGILYNVSGLQAVEILLDDGRRVRVGTDQPDALVRALQAATAVTPSKTIDEFPKDVAWRRRVRLITGGVGVLAVVWIASNFYVYSRPPSVALSRDRFEVGTGLHSADVSVSDIQSVTLVNELPRILRRTNGFSSGGLLRGNFTLEQWGSGKLFINRNAPPYLVVRTRDSFVVVNFEGAARTREIYGQLVALTERQDPGGQRP